ARVHRAAQDDLGQDPSCRAAAARGQPARPGRARGARGRMGRREVTAMRARAGMATAVVAAWALAAPMARADAPGPPGVDGLRARIAGVLLRGQVPGAGIALVEGEQIVWTGGVGVADRASGAPVTADTLFRTGSITKSFIALALVRLAEQGRVDLDAPV